MVVGTPVAEPKFEDDAGHAGDQIGGGIQAVALRRHSPDEAFEAAHCENPTQTAHQIVRKS